MGTGKANSLSPSLIYGRNQLKKLGLSDDQIFGVMGSLMGESGRSLDTTAFNPNDPNGGSRGIAQWQGARWDNMVSFAQAANMDPGDYRAQWDYIVHELMTTESKALRELAKAKTREESAKVWTNVYERPNKDFAHHDKRAANAHYAASLFGAPGPDGKMGPGYTDKYGDGDVFSLTGANPGTGVASAAGGGGLDFLGGIGNLLGGGLGGLIGTGTSQVESEAPGPMNFGQGLAVALGGLAGGGAGAQLANSLFASGAEDMTFGEGLAMGVGGLLGGLPGAALGQMLAQGIGNLFGTASGSPADNLGGGPNGLAPTSSVMPQARPTGLGTDVSVSQSNGPSGPSSSGWNHSVGAW